MWNLGIKRKQRGKETKKKPQTLTYREETGSYQKVSGWGMG